MKSSIKRRRSLWIRRSGLFKGLLDGGDVPEMKTAETREDLEQAFRLVYQEYLRLGYTQKNSAHMFFHIHNLLPNSTVMAMKDGKKVISTVTQVIDDDYLGIPMDSLYQEELNKLRFRGRKLLEGSALAISPEYRWGTLFTHIFRKTCRHALRNNVNDICIMVNPKHVKFYKTILLFDSLGPERFYPRVGATAVALRINLDTYKEKVMEAYCDCEPDLSLYRFLYDNKAVLLEEKQPVASRSESEQKKITHEEIAAHFLIKEGNVLKDLNPQEITYITKHYPSLSSVIPADPKNPVRFAA